MKIRDMYPLVVVDEPATVREWYVRHLGFTVVAETDWFVYLAAGDDGRRYGLAFMRAGLDHQLPQFRTALAGDALVLTIEVDDVAEAHERIRATGIDPAVSLRDEPWGQRHFMLRDPAGAWVDIVQQTEPEPGFLDEATSKQMDDLARATDA